MSDENTAELRDTDAEFKRLKQRLYRLHATDVGEIFQGVNPQGALRQFDVRHNGDQQISQSLKSPLFTQQTWSCGSTKLKHNSNYIRLRTMTNATD